MKTSTKTKKVIQKKEVNLKEKKVVKLSPIQEKLKKGNFPLKGRILFLVDYFAKNKPQEGKLYNADSVYKGNKSSVNQIGLEGQRYVKEILGFRVIGKEKGSNDKLFKTFTLKKVK